MVYCTSDTLPLVEVRSGTKFTAPFGSVFTKCRRTSNGLKLQHTIKQACLSVGSSLFPFGKHRFLVDRKVLLWDGLVDRKVLLWDGLVDRKVLLWDGLVDRKVLLWDGLVPLWGTSHF